MSSSTVRAPQWDSVFCLFIYLLIWHWLLSVTYMCKHDPGLSWDNMIINAVGALGKILLWVLSLHILTTKSFLQLFFCFDSLNNLLQYTCEWLCITTHKCFQMFICFDYFQEFIASRYQSVQKSICWATYSIKHNIS